MGELTLQLTCGGIAKAAAEAKANEEAEAKTKAEKAAAKLANDAEKEVAKVAEEPKAVDDSLAPPLSKVEEEKVRVKKFSFEGVKYLKDTNGTIYDLASQDRIGVWNDESKKIVFDAKADEEDECSEEEYE